MIFDSCIHLCAPNSYPDIEHNHHPIAPCRLTSSNPTSKEAPPDLITHSSYWQYLRLLLTPALKATCSLWLDQGISKLPQPPLVGVDPSTQLCFLINHSEVTSLHCLKTSLRGEMDCLQSNSDPQMSSLFSLDSWSSPVGKIDTIHLPLSLSNSEG